MDRAGKDYVRKWHLNSGLNKEITQVEISRGSRHKQRENSKVLG